ncbi:putative membrane protein [Owenweeksia hongkongensis DSM 17368]|uniref:Putative membrane protein n=1 Tax=Owenweeksia hongkongensis (strain DSM 17368 / CIP 108786 / JCM 12287 / NRRL B-23963 / UST20020801) TaxID=926562 RepID=G8R2V3_OWEHD|nr:rhomboid family intramembrane serine protease [Owenweeksia hongkongensis]AEV31908.1 putative membrane protein [Owenweeksia hongkongensis DSM 17368]
MNKTHTALEDSNQESGGSGRLYMLRPFYFVLLLWVIFWADSRFMLDLYHLGVLPGSAAGMFGIFTSPLIHGSLMHLVNNTFPILALGAGLFYFYPRIAWKVIIVSWLASGLMTWLIGRESYHIGASGLIYALAGFIFLCGILRKQANLLALSLLVVFFYGSLVWGILPIEDTVSWEAHLGGAFAGFGLAIYYRKSPPRSKKYSWELVEEEVEEAESHDDIPEEIWNREAWEEYSGSNHGIRYIYRTKEPDDLNADS